MLSLKTHGILDYVAGAALVVLSGIFEAAAPRNLFLIAGFGLIGYSLITNYRYSVAKVIPLGAHMALDVTVGAVVLVAPWLFGYRATITGGETAVHVVMGLGAIALVAFTNRRTEMSRVAPRAAERQRERELAGTGRR